MHYADQVSFVPLSVVGDHLPKKTRRYVLEQQRNLAQYLDEYGRSSIEREREMKLSQQLQQRLLEERRKKEALEKANQLLEARSREIVEAANKVRLAHELLQGELPPVQNAQALATRMMNLEKARAAQEAKKQKEQELYKERVKNLKKARKARNR